MLIFITTLFIAYRPKTTNILYIFQTLLGTTYHSAYFKDLCAPDMRDLFRDLIVVTANYWQVLPR